MLDAEKRKGISRFPFVILLDEANLSPMEYYWSDFMNICDDLGSQSNEAAIKASKEEILRMSAEHAELASKIAEDTARLTALKKELELVGSIEDIQKKATDLQGHHNYLSGATASLEAEFQQLISRTREKMVGIAFDGFMASKMLHAAAQWEAEAAAEKHQELVDAINDVSATDKTPDASLYFPRK